VEPRSGFEGGEMAFSSSSSRHSLHEARRKVRAEKRWTGPFYWAPFVLIGSRTTWRRRPRARNRIERSFSDASQKR
jgi:hypothetical protein